MTETIVRLRQELPNGASVTLLHWRVSPSADIAAVALDVLRNEVSERSAHPACTTWIENVGPLSILVSLEMDRQRINFYPLTREVAR
jgi:hypothetical protein